MRLIDADALKTLFVETMADIEKKSYIALDKCHVHAACKMLCDMIDDAETIEAEPVRHGKLLWHEDWGHPSFFEAPEIFNDYWICSVCGIDLLQYIQSHFPGIPSYVECVFEDIPTLERCPYCGAKFDEEEESP